MPSSSLDSVRELVRAGQPEGLVGLAECSWLDVKSEVYVLDRPHGAEELLKDVAAFANAQDGGILLVGFTTRKENDQEVIDQVRPVPRAVVDLDRYRKLLDRIIPVPLYVSVDWIDRGGGKGILVIDVPVQPPVSLPFVVPGPARTGKDSQQAGAVPVRDGDRTRWLTVADMQRLLAAGWSQKGGHSEEVLRDLISQAVAAARAADQPAVPVIQPGEGDPSWERRFREVADAVRSRIRLGEAASRVYHEGPGPVQHFSGHGGEAWILCAVPGRKPVMVAEPVWEQLREAGAEAPGADAFTALGFPVLGKDVAPAERVVAPYARKVELAGGTWGPGFLASNFPSDGHHWEAAPQFSFNALHEGELWTSSHQPPQLRIRVTASLPAPAAGRLITPDRMGQLAAELPDTDFALAARNLADRGSAIYAFNLWTPGRTGRSTDRWSLGWAIQAPDGTPALAVEVILRLSADSVVIIAELRIQGRVAWRAALLDAGADVARSEMPVSLAELTPFLTSAWRAVTDDLPAMLDPDPTFGPFSGPPLVELRLSAEQPPEQGLKQLGLTDMIDFSPWGGTDRTSLPLMVVTIAGPVRLTDQERYKRAGEAIAFMAQGFGFSRPRGHLPRG
jgi:hypothetical protein